MTSPLDDLTRLPLRNAYLDAATKALEEARAAATPVSVLVMDVDQFKLVNDTFGHLQGDDVLREVAELLRASLRGRDIPARYAGDEFVALLPGTPPEAARDVAERICAAVRAHPFRRRDGQGTVPVTTSIGVAGFPAHGDDHDAVFGAADRALYTVKRRGRDGVAVAVAGDAQPAHLPLSIDRFVGRAREMSTLVGLLEEAAAGQPRIAAIAGEAGVGKTTLLRQLEPEVRLRGGSLVMGRSQEADVQPPYGPWAEVINAIRRLGVVPARPWRELSRLVPDLPLDGTPDPRGGSKYLLLEEIAEYLRLAAHGRPLVVVLDDMQWADSASWDTLEYLVPQLDAERILLCLTIRAEEAGGETLERRRRLSRNERFRELKLQRLTREEVRQWIEAAFHRQDVGREFLAFLYRQTEGNPLFVVQVLRTLVDERHVWHTGEKWDWKPVSELRLPVAVSDLISRRVGRLSARSQDVLVTAAVVGREFDLDVVIAAGAGEEDEVLDAVDEGVQASVLVASAKRGGDRYSFTHALLAETLRESVNPRRLRRVHEKVADALAARDPEAFAEIATHYDRGGNPAKAYEYALRAGERARHVYAHEEAIDFLRLAERVAETPAQVAEARVKLAEIAETAGRYQEAEELCDLAIEWFTGAGESSRALSLRLARERVRGLLGQSAHRTLEACRPLEAEARQPGNEREHVALLLVLSRESGRAGDPAAAQRYAEECAAVAERLGEPSLLADSLNRLALTLHRAAPERAHALYERALGIYAELRDSRGQAHCHSNLGVLHTSAGKWRDAAAEFETAMALGRAVGTPDLRGLFAINLGVVHMRLGDHARARDLFGEALALFAATRSTERQVYALYNLAHLDRERGAMDSAAELYEIAATMARQLGHADIEIGAHAGAGLSQLSAGDVVRAREAHEAATRLAAQRADWFQGRELLEALGVQLLAHDGALGDAVQRLEEAAARGQAVDSYATAWLMAHCAGLLARHDPHHARVTWNEWAARTEALGLEAMSRQYRALLAGS